MIVAVGIICFLVGGALGMLITAIVSARDEED